MSIATNGELYDFAVRYWGASVGLISWNCAELYPLNLIPDGKLLHAKKTYAKFTQIDERPILLMDTTFWGGAGRGCILTSGLLYVNDAAARVADLSAIESLLLEPTETGTTFQLTANGEVVLGNITLGKVAELAARLFFEKLTAGDLSVDVDDLKWLLVPASNNAFLNDLSQATDSEEILFMARDSPCDDEVVLQHTGDFVLTNKRLFALARKDFHLYAGIGSAKIRAVDATRNLRYSPTVSPALNILKVAATIGYAKLRDRYEVLITLSDGTEFTALPSIGHQDALLVNATLGGLGVTVEAKY